MHAGPGAGIFYKEVINKNKDAAKRSVIKNTERRNH
jgi:hypothetical protein